REPYQCRHNPKPQTRAHRTPTPSVPPSEPVQAPAPTVHAAPASYSGDLDGQRTTMKTEPLLILLTAVNAGLFAYQMVWPRPSTAATTDVQTVIRGRALEIVDDRGRVRATLSVLPA